MSVEMTCYKEFLKDPGKQGSKKVTQGEGRGINGKLIHVGGLELGLLRVKQVPKLSSVDPPVADANHCKQESMPLYRPMTSRPNTKCNLIADLDQEGNK